MTEHIRLEVDADGVAHVTLDLRERSVNVFTPGFTRDLQTVVQALTGHADIVGAVVTSGKAGGFMAGADLKDFVNVHARGLAPAEAAALVAPAAGALRALERCGKPVAVVIDGFALGGGFELCLACHHRVMVDDPKTVVGLPEVTVGLLPAGGGTQRLPRLVGVARALPLLLSGRHVPGREALELGLVDALLPRADAPAAARAWVLANPGHVAPWDRKGFQVPGGAGALAPHAAESFGVGLAHIRARTHDNEPAPAAILASVYEGTVLPIDRGLAVEAGHFGRLLAGPVARNLMRTGFILAGAARKGVRRPPGIAPQPVPFTARADAAEPGALPRYLAEAAGWVGAGVKLQGHVGAQGQVVIEIVQGDPAALPALARAVDVALHLRALPVVVQRVPVLRRLAEAYAAAGRALREAGVAEPLVRNAARQAGFATVPPGAPGDGRAQAGVAALADIKSRLLCSMALEAARCVEEGLAPHAADVDLGSVFALGYPRWTGGPLSYIEMLGLPAFVAECDRLAAAHGEAFRPSGGLRARAAAGQPFHTAD